MTQKEFRGTRGALLVGVAALASACSDSPTKPNDARPVDEVSPLAVISCTGDASAKTISCVPAKDEMSLRGNLIIGGQGTYLKLSADPNTTPGPNSVTITNVRLQNLLAQPLGTADGASESVDGIRIFFHDLGNVNVANPDGYGNFTGSHQPFFQYAGALQSGATSAPRSWTLTLAPGTTSYSFLVYVSGAVPHDDQYLRWNSEQLSPGTGAYYAVWGSSSTDVFAVGANGRALRYDGSSYNAVPTGTTNTLYDVWGSSLTNVYAVGANGFVARFDGSAFSPVTLPGAPRTLWDVDGGAAGDAIIAGQAFDGTLTRAAVFINSGSGWSGPTYLSATSNSSAYGVWVASATEAFAVGSAGQIWHLAGGVWSPMSSPVTTPLNGVWGSSPSNVYAVGSANGGTATLLHYDGSAWTRVPMTTNTFLWKVGGTSANNIYAVGGNTGATSVATIMHFDGHSWLAETSPTTGQALYGTFTSGWTNFAVGTNGGVFKTVR